MYFDKLNNEDIIIIKIKFGQNGHVIIYEKLIMPN